MQRDMDLIRLMVLAMEDAPTGFAPQFQFDGYTQDQIGYHAYLLADAGFAVGTDVTGLDDDSPVWLLTHLTWAGHEFAAASRDVGVWDTATGQVRSKVGAVTVGVLIQVLSAIAKQRLGLS